MGPRLRDLVFKPLLAYKASSRNLEPVLFPTLHMIDYDEKTMHSLWVNRIKTHFTFSTKELRAQ